VKGEYQAKEPTLQRYLRKVKEACLDFLKVEFTHVPREHNTRADILSRLASTKRPGNNRIVIQSTLSQPSIQQQAAMADTFQTNAWTIPLIQFIRDGTLPWDDKEAMKIKRKAPKFTIINEKLYKRGFSVPLLKCLEPDEAQYVLAELHEGICGNHSGGKSLAKKLLRAGYY